MMFRRTQQQQPGRDRIAMQQQMAGSNDFQAQPRPGQAGADRDKARQQMGEGSYEGTREYQDRIRRYLDQADVNADAQKAAPRSEQEARELEQAEKQGRSHSRGER